MSKIFFIADQHFGHKKIINYENRPFETVKDMDKKMIDNWNNVVNVDDKVFVLGDFSFYNKQVTQDIFNSLKGNKYLVMGNHDSESISFYRAIGFKGVYEYPIVYDNFWMLSHEPMYINNNMPYANIFGHVHSCKEYTDFSSQSYCVSVERINYTPIDFEDIKKVIKSNS